MIDIGFMTPEFNMFDVQKGYHKDAALLLYPLGFSDYFGGGFCSSLLNIFNNGSSNGNSEVLDDKNKRLIIESFKCFENLKLFAKSNNIILFGRFHGLNKDYKTFIENSEQFPFLEVNDFFYENAA